MGFNWFETIFSVENSYWGVGANYHNLTESAKIDGCREILILSQNW